MSCKTTLTAESQEALLTALRRCFFVETACDLVGIPRSSLYTWLSRGKRELGGPYHDFLVAYRRVLAELEGDLVSAIAASTEWTSCAWVLERRWPSHWSNNRKELRQLRREVDALLKERRP